MRLADALNSTLDLNALMHRVADLVRAVIDYRIFAILLLNERTNELWMRFQIGYHAGDRAHARQAGPRHRRSGRAGAQIDPRRGRAPHGKPYINANPDVVSELAVPLFVKNKVIGVIDIQSEHLGYFTPSTSGMLELTASRMAVAVENARLYTRVSRQAQTLTVLHEISHEITSILDVDDLLERIGHLMKRVIDFQMFTILLWNERTRRMSTASASARAMGSAWCASAPSSSARG